jgi:acetyl-CoA acetyltransferase
VASRRPGVAIVGAADTPVGKVADLDTQGLCALAAQQALADAGLTFADVDGLVTCNAMSQPFLYPAEALAEYLQIFPRYCVGLGAGGAAAIAVIQHAALAIEAGLCETVLVTMADRLRSGLDREQARKMQSAAGHPEFETPYGPSAPALYALMAQAYLHRYNVPREALAAVAVTMREHAALHPAAQKRDLITIEDVLSARPVATPLGVLDCSLVSDGGAAIVLTSVERAQHLRQPPVRLLGFGEAHSHEHLTGAHDLTRSAATESGRRAYRSAGLGPREIDVAGIYDCFTPVVLIQLEDLDFCARGEAGAFVLDGGIRRSGGTLPVNPHGGLLSHCHPGNPGSMFHVTEIVAQLRGQAAARQIDGAEVGLVHAQGGTLSSHATLILGGAATA